jgi:hypothetical protein
MNESERQFSFTRTASSTGGRKKPSISISFMRSRAQTTLAAICSVVAFAVSMVPQPAAGTTFVWACYDEPDFSLSITVSDAALAAAGGYLRIQTGSDALLAITATYDNYGYHRYDILSPSELSFIDATVFTWPPYIDTSRAESRSGARWVWYPPPWNSPLAGVACGSVTNCCTAYCVGQWAISVTDLIASSLTWDTVNGGADLQYTIGNAPLSSPTTAKLFWATGPAVANVISGAAVISTHTIPSGASGPSGVIHVPAANFANPPATATHVLLVLDPDNLVQESDEGNNVAAIPVLDLAIVSLGWNNTEGGLDFRYRVDGGVLPAATTAKMYWASGTSVADKISDTPFFTQQIPAGFTGLSDIIRVTGSILKNAPGGVTHLLLVADPDSAIAEARKQNNLNALPDANIVFSNPTRDAATVSPRTYYAIKDFLREAGQQSCTITRTVSTPEKQADIMFECSFNGTCANYAAAGQAVLAVYNTMTAGLTRAQIRAQKPTIVAAMLAKILEVGPSNVSHHCADPSVFNVVDIWPGSFTLSGELLFIRSACGDSRISKFLSPYAYQCAVRYDPVFHLEFPQTGSAGPAPHPNFGHPDIDVFTEFGAVSGVVSTNHVMFSLDAFAGDVVTLLVNATGVFPGSQATNDDSMIFVINEVGKLLVSNDNDVESGLQATIQEFTIPATGRYLVGVSTFPNQPVLDTNGVVVAWPDNGGSSIAFDLSATVISSVPRLIVRANEMGQMILEWRGTGVLQEASSLRGGWADVVGAASPQIRVMSAPQKFFRLRTP